MADANAVIQQLGLQLAQAIVDKAILTAELAELRAKYEPAADSEAVGS
jgi:hypothetical protein